MKKRSHTRRLIPIALLLSMVLVCGTVFAYMFMRTEPTGVQFIPASVACTLDDTTSDNAVSNIRIKNDKDKGSNVPAYLRVRLVTYWVDGEGNVVPKTSPTLSVGYDTGKWVKGSDNTFYYKIPAGPNEGFTTNLLTSPIALIKEDGYKQVVDIFGEAIQADPTTAVTESWNVTLSGTTIAAAP